MVVLAERAAPLSVMVVPVVPVALVVTALHWRRI
jgi:hypothetical protein